jgi:hypothetical protein
VWCDPCPDAMSTATGTPTPMFRRLVSVSPLGWGVVVPALVRHAALATVTSLRDIDDALLALDDDVGAAAPSG